MATKNKDKKELSDKDIEKKISDLKIEMLKQHDKRKRIKKEIARLLTMKNLKNKVSSKSTKSGGKK
jgi:ribosomal protein L29